MRFRQRAFLSVLHSAEGRKVGRTSPSWPCVHTGEWCVWVVVARWVVEDEDPTLWTAVCWRTGWGWREGSLMWQGRPETLSKVLVTSSLLTLPGRGVTATEGAGFVLQPWRQEAAHTSLVMCVTSFCSQSPPPQPNVMLTIAALACFSP